MKRVGVREFRDRANHYLAGDEIVAIERHGQPVGFFVPAKGHGSERLAVALAQLEETVRQVTDATGLSEEALSRLFDLNAPLPRPSEHPGNGISHDDHAPRG